MGRYSMGERLALGQRFVVYPLVLLAFFLAMLVRPVSAAPTSAAIIVDEATGKVHFARSADVKTYPASLTKVMTLYMTFAALESGKLKMTQKLPVSQVAAGRSPTKLGLAPGATITVQDAIKSLIVYSANDAATVLGEALGGSERNFAKLMTERARALGMADTTFKNASGLPHSEQMTTARDMATLGLAIRRDFPQYYPLFSTKEFTFNGRTYRTHNRVMASDDSVDGIKTGYTHASGFNLLTSVERDGARLVAVVLGGKTAAARDAYMRQILNTTYARLADPEAVQVADAAATPSRQPAATRVAAVAMPTGGSGGSGAWAVQVGAFRSYTAAERQAQSVAGLVAPRTTPVQVAVVAAENNPKPLYRARLVGFDSAREARRVCSQLKQKKIGCLPVSL